MQQNINSFNIDMASVVNALREYNGEPHEDVNIWLRDVNLVKTAGNIPDIIMRNILLLKLRGMAQSWASSLITQNPDIPLSSLATALKQRFENTKHNFDVTERFLKGRTCKNKEEYKLMLQDASLLFNKNLINVEPLIKLVISRSPPELRTLFYQFTYENSDWNEFVKKAEECMWLPFPETATQIGEINHIQPYSKRNSQTRSSGNKQQRNKYQNNKNFGQFCEVHGECGHTSETCRILLTLKIKPKHPKKNQ